MPRKKEAPRERTEWEQAELEKLIPGLLGLEQYPPARLSAKDQLNFLLSAGIPIDTFSVGHLYHSIGYLSKDVSDELLIHADSELFKTSILNIFKRTLEKAEDLRSFDIEAALRSVMLTKDGEYDARLIGSPTPEGVLKTFERLFSHSFRYKERREDEDEYFFHELLMKAIEVWLDPYPKEERDELIFRINEIIYRRQVKENRERKKDEHLPELEVDYFSLSERKKREYLEHKFADLIKADLEKALRIFYSLSRKQPLLYIKTLANRLVRQQKIDIAQQAIRFSLDQLKTVPRKEERKRRRAELVARPERPLPPDLKPKIEAENVDYFSLIELCEETGSFQTIEGILTHISGHNYRRLAVDLGVSGEQLAALLSWAFTEVEKDEKYHPTERDGYYYYDLQNILNIYFDEPRPFQEQDTNKLYKKIVRLRIELLGEEGIKTLHPCLYTDVGFLKWIVHYYLTRGESEKALPWAVRYTERARDQGYTYGDSLSDLLQNVGREN